MKRITEVRHRALKWFADHEADPSSVLLTQRPSARMLGLMVRDGHVVREPVGQFGCERWLLTEQGRELLAGKRNANPIPPSNTPLFERVLVEGECPAVPTTQQQRNWKMDHSEHQSIRADLEAALRPFASDKPLSEAQEAIHRLAKREAREAKLRAIAELPDEEIHKIETPGK